MKKIQIATTKKGQIISLQTSPRGISRILVNDMATDTRFYGDESLEDAIFMVTSSSPIQDREDAEMIARKVLQNIAS